MKNRSKEEIEGIIQTFGDIFLDMMGRELTKELMIEVISDLLRQKEKEMIRQRFLDFSPKNLRQVIQLTVKEPEPEPYFDDFEPEIKEVKEVKKKKGQKKA